VDVKITDKGLKLLKVIDEQMVDWEKNLHTISEKEAATTNALLDKWRS